MNQLENRVKWNKGQQSFWFATIDSLKLKAGDYTDPQPPKSSNSRCDTIYSGDIDRSFLLPITCDKLLWQLVLIISIIAVILTPINPGQIDLPAEIA